MLHASCFAPSPKRLWRAHDKFHERRGFSLIEILVVVAVSAMISSLAITYSKLGQRQISLYVETQKIGETIFRAKALALATYNNPSAPSCGYGFQIDYVNRIYTLFSYNPTPIPSNCNIVSINPTYRFPIVQTEILNRDIIFNTSAPNTLYAVLFVPPEPRIFISNNTGGTVSFPIAASSVYISTIDGSAQKTITVSPAGQVEF